MYGECPFIPVREEMPCQFSPVQELTFSQFDSVSDGTAPVSADDMREFCISEGGTYTLLGYILSDQCDRSVNVAVFSDRYRTEIIDRREFTGCILKQMDGALSFISKYNRTTSVIKGTYREDRKDLPDMLTRDAVAFAMMNRDHGLDDPMLVSIFPDRLTITSPGGGMTVCAPNA